MQTPDWGFKPYSFSVTEFQGSVVSISVGTYGEGWQQNALQDLTAKFGNPTNTKKSLLQNAFGVKVEKISAYWKKPGYTVSFDGVGEERDIGFITIKSDAEALERRAADEWTNKNKTGPKM
jgi:hypothetical protein